MNLKGHGAEIGVREEIFLLLSEIPGMMGLFI